MSTSMSYLYHILCNTLIFNIVYFRGGEVSTDASFHKKKHDLDGCASFFHSPASKTSLTKGQKPFAGYSLENGTGPNFSQMLFTATLSAGSHLTLSSSFIANQRAASCSRSVS